MTPGDAPGMLTSERVYDGRLLTVDRDTVRNPAGTRIELEVVRHPGAAAVVPFLDPLDSDDPTVLLIQQYRYAAGGMIWEIPAGVLRPGEDPATCARRELREETGATAKTIEHLTTIYTTPGFTDERIHLFMATGITPGEPHQEEDELIAVQALPLSRVLEMIRDGAVVDGKSITALLFVAGYRIGL